MGGKELVQSALDETKTAKLALIAAGLGTEDVDELTSIVSTQIFEVLRPFADQEGSECEEAWECVNPQDPTILAATEAFITEKKLSQEGIVTAVREFASKQAIYCQSQGYWTAPLGDERNF